MFTKIEVRTKKETSELAKKIARNLQKNDVLALYGELGTGKTFFTQELCKYLAVKEFVTSPTFVIMNEYTGKFTIRHIDLYRLDSLEEVLELGIPDIFEDCLTIIEWAEKVEEILPENVWKIKIELQEDKRCFQISHSG